MERFDTLKITLVFIATIVFPSVLLAFFAIRALERESHSVREAIRTRYENRTAAFRRHVQRLVLQPTEEIHRIIEPLAAGRPGDRSALKQAVVAWTGSHPVYDSAAILDPRGVILHPESTALDRPPATDYPTPGLFEAADRLEAEGRPYEARKAWELLLQRFRSDPVVQVEALNALSRLYLAQPEPDPFNAQLLADELLTRYPTGRNRYGDFVFPEVLLRLAHIWRHPFRNPERADATLLRLLQLLAENRVAIPHDQYVRWRAEAQEQLRASGPSPRIARALEEIAGIEERSARAHEFRRLIERRFHPELREALAGRAPKADFLKVEEANRPAVIYYQTVTSPGESRPYALVAFRLDLEALRRTVLEREIESFGDEDGYLRLAERTPTPARAGTLRVAARPLAFPLDHLQVEAYLKDYGSVEEAARQSATTYFWAIVLACAAIGAGAILTIRTVWNEIRTGSMKTDFVTTITHELKTPLTSIGMFIETLQAGRIKDADEAQECLEVMARETERLSKLIDRVLNFSKLESRQKRFDFRLTDVGELLEEAVEVFRNHIPQDDDVDIELNVAQDPSVVLVDRAQILEVLLNLMTNAYKYGGHEGQRRLIKVNLKERRRCVLIEVEDNGPGIPAWEQRLIFRKFYRGADTHRREIEGTGIGLTLSRAIARAHKGDLWVSSREGCGSRFTLRLPKIRRKEG